LVSVRQSHGAVNEILALQIARAKRGFHARRVRIMRDLSRRENSSVIFVGISAEIVFGIGSAKDFHNWD
jgi:hypothetical protein